MMKIGIMQPYFFPYIGYFQLIAAVDLFIVYDNIKYTKKGWINRNRMLQNGKDVMFSLPLKNDSDSSGCVRTGAGGGFQPRQTAESDSKGHTGAHRILRRRFRWSSRSCGMKDANLFRFLHHSIVKTCEHLGITTEIRVSSDIAIDHDLKNQDKVLALCEAVGASTYVNAIGGMELYSKETFREKGIDLKFIQSKPFEYAQFGDTFVPWLSIIDVMMFNPLDTIRTCISTNYELI